MTTAGHLQRSPQERSAFNTPIETLTRPVARMPTRETTEDSGSARSSHRGSVRRTPAVEEAIWKHEQGGKRHKLGALLVLGNGDGVHPFAGGNQHPVPPLAIVLPVDDVRPPVKRADDGEEEQRAHQDSSEG